MLGLVSFASELIQLTYLKEAHLDDESLDKLFKESPVLEAQMKDLSLRVNQLLDDDALHVSFSAIEQWLFGHPRLDRSIVARDVSRCIRLFREAREFFEGKVLCGGGGINLGTLISSNFALYPPLAGAAALALAEICTFSLSSKTILEQVGWMIQEEEGGLCKEDKAVSVAYRLTSYGVSYFAYPRFTTLLQQGKLPSQLSLPRLARARIIAAGLASFIAVLVSHPLDTIRVNSLSQTDKDYKGVQHTLLNICRHGGVRSLYSGISASCLTIVPSMVINHCTQHQLKSTWQHLRPNDPPFLINLTCGSLAGLAASTATFPIEVVQRRMQMEGQIKVDIGGLCQTLRDIITKEGIPGLYKGIRPHCLKVILNAAVAFTAFEIIKMPACALDLIKRLFVAAAVARDHAIASPLEVCIIKDDIKAEGKSEIRLDSRCNA